MALAAVRETLALERTPGDPSAKNVSRGDIAGVQTSQTTPRVSSRTAPRPRRARARGARSRRRRPAGDDRARSDRSPPPRGLAHPRRGRHELASSRKARGRLRPFPRRFRCSCRWRWTRAPASGRRAPPPPARPELGAAAAALNLRMWRRRRPRGSGNRGRARERVEVAAAVGARGRGSRRRRGGGCAGTPPAISLGSWVSERRTPSVATAAPAKIKSRVKILDRRQPRLSRRSSSSDVGKWNVSERYLPLPWLWTGHISVGVDGYPSLTTQSSFGDD